MLRLHELPPELHAPLGPAAGVGRLDEARAADRGHVRRRARIVRLRAGVAGVARRDELRDAGVVEVGLVARRVRRLGTAPAVADDLHARVCGCRVVRGVKAIALIVVCEDEQELAIRTGGAGEVEIECGLDRPVVVGGRVRGQRRGRAVLVDDREAAARLRARRQAVVRPVLGEIALGVRIVVRVDDRDRRVGIERGVELVRAHEIRWTEARRGGVRLYRPGAIGADMRVAVHGAAVAHALTRLLRDRAERVVGAIAAIIGALAGCTTRGHKCRTHHEPMDPHHDEDRFHGTRHTPLRGLRSAMHAWRFASRTPAYTVTCSQWFSFTRKRADISSRVVSGEDTTCRRGTTSSRHAVIAFVDSACHVASRRCASATATRGHTHVAL